MARATHRGGAARQATRIDLLIDNPAWQTSRSADGASDGNGVSLERLEFDRVTAAVARRASCAAGAQALRDARPIADPERRREQVTRLHEAIRRSGEPEAWCATGPDDPAAALDPERSEPLDGIALVMLRGWLEAGQATRLAWTDAEASARHASLAALAAGLPALDALRERLATALDPDGRVRDEASPALARARRGVADGERDLESRLGRWAREFGENAYVTRHDDRFVALVPAAGFPRRRGIVHDVSGSGQSLFVEPLDACDDNNRLIELRAAAVEEERRVLLALGREVDEAREPLRELVAVLVELDTLRARAQWAREFGGIAILPGASRLRLIAARHPLLAMGARRDAVVPLDLELDPPGRLLLVSGPNMGGKTVLLKTVGLAVALSHAAFPVPAAEGSEVPEIAVVLADLGDEQSVDRGISTFAAHVERLAEMAGEAGPDRLLLVDELGTGTDPEEGAALGRALIEHFARRGAWGVITTHLGSLKRVAGETAGVVNGSLEFDLEALRPLYRFVPGVPGASHALAVAQRLGLDPALLERARALTGDESRAVERLLGELQTARRALDREQERLAAARSEAESAAAAARAASEDTKQELARLRRSLTHESEQVLAQARALWQTVQREARRAEKRADVGATRAGLSAAEASLETLGRAVDDALAAHGGLPATAPPPRLEPGVRVRVRDLGVEAELLSGPDAEGRVELQRGAWKIQSHVSRLEAADGGAEPAAETRRAAASWEPAESAGLEVDLRGMESGEALAALDQGLDRAVVSGLQELRVIHGIGRGVLRAAVERHLRAHPQVASQRPGQVGEGGRGVTIARLR